MVDTKNLEQRGRKWWAYKTVAPALREAVGKHNLRINLHTSDLKEAQRLRPHALSQLSSELDRARRLKEGKLNALEEEALTWRNTDMSNASAHDDNGEDDIKSYLLSEKAEKIEAEEGREQAKWFYDLASGQKTPLDLHLEQYLAEQAIEARTAQDKRTALGRLSEWKAGLSLESIDRRTAGEFITQTLSPGHPRTANKYISNLSSYWRWLMRKGIVEENPWRDQLLSTRRQKGALATKKEREFTDEEIRRLHGNPCRERLKSAMLIAALSGMRLEEICMLKVEHCADDMFDIQASKTESGIRKIPIHSELQDLVKERVAGKASTDFLIHELGVSPRAETGRKRSMPLGKEFSRYRKKLGIDDRVEWQRRSRVNFHSYRRWFITKAEQAGQPPWLIEAVVGHKRQGMSLGRYAGGPSIEQLRECVESVTLANLPVQEPTESS